MVPRLSQTPQNRDSAGRPSALVDRCPHRNLALSLGTVHPDGNLECAYHGWRFAALVVLATTAAAWFLWPDAAGYIGGGLTDQLLGKGHEVRIYDFLLYEDRYLKPIDFVRGDVLANVGAGRAPTAGRGCVVLLFMPLTAIGVGWLAYRLIISS